MEPHKALDITLRVYKLKAKDLALATGVSEDAISRYRNGKQDLYGKSIFSLISYLPKDAKKFFFELINSGGKAVSVPLEILV